MNYYNEIDPFAAAWLRELIKAGHIAPGEVDERDIQDVVPSDLRGFVQCHFFAGIGGWSYALRLAGWPDDRPVWTGSSPCQPFSAAGKRGGTADERHLWPAFYHLIFKCQPVVVFGEQVASKGGLAWLDTVQADLEGAGYTVGAADTCAAGFGAPHIRQRLYFVADAQQRRGYDGRGLYRGCIEEGARIETSERSFLRNKTEGNVPTSSMANAAREQQHGSGNTGAGRWGEFADRGELGDTNDSGSQGRRIGWDGARERFAGASSLVGGFWERADWLWCRDQKYRPVEPGTFPLAHGAANRVGRLRGYGNAIVAPQAAAFIASYLDVTQ